MEIFYKIMIISACFILSLLIGFAGQDTYKETTIEKIVWLIFYAYAFGLLHVVYKIVVG